MGGPGDTLARDLRHTDDSLRGRKVDLVTRFWAGLKDAACDSRLFHASALPGLIVAKSYIHPQGTVPTPQVQRHPKQNFFSDSANVFRM